MSARKGKRYDTEPKLNIKKVIAVIIAILVVIMFVVGIKEILKDRPMTNEKVFALAYYTIYENGKWGVVDTKGNIVISPSYDEMIIIPDNTKPVFVCQEKVDYQNNTFETKIVNKSNEEIFTSYDKVEVL